ncbi:MAG: hypothetical protein WAQ24_02555 [Candidatus Saccharimonadales bacterium]
MLYIGGETVDSNSKAGQPIIAERIAERRRRIQAAVPETGIKGFVGRIKERLSLVSKRNKALVSLGGLALAGIASLGILAANSSNEDVASAAKTTITNIDTDKNKQVVKQGETSTSKLGDKKDTNDMSDIGKKPAAQKPATQAGEGRTVKLVEHKTANDAGTVSGVARKELINTYGIAKPSSAQIELMTRALLAANGITSQEAHHLKVGQEINVPDDTGDTITTKDGKKITIKGLPR